MELGSRAWFRDSLFLLVGAAIAFLAMYIGFKVNNDKIVDANQLESMKKAIYYCEKLPMLNKEHQRYPDNFETVMLLAVQLQKCADAIQK